MSPGMKHPLHLSGSIPGTPNLERHHQAEMMEDMMTDNPLWCEKLVAARNQHRYNNYTLKHARKTESANTNFYLARNNANQNDFSSSPRYINYSTWSLRNDRGNKLETGNYFDRRNSRSESNISALCSNNSGSDANNESDFMFRGEMNRDFSNTVMTTFSPRKLLLMKQKRDFYPSRKTSIGSGSEYKSSLTYYSSAKESEKFEDIVL